MSSQLATDRRSVVAAPPEESPLGLVAAAAAIRGAAVAVSGALLAAAVSLVLWALTPASGADATVAVRAGVAGFAAANLIPVTIAGVALTIPPLLFTLLIAALLVVTVGRGRFLPVGRSQETVAVLVTAASYGLAVAVITRAFAPEGVVPAAWVWTATALAFVAVAAATVCGRSAWHDWWRTGVPRWLSIASRAAGIGVCVMVAGGGLALTAAMVTHFGAMVGVGALAAPSWTDGLGMALLGVAYVPNAVVAAVGYVSGVGFEIGAGTYSPFGSSTVDLPAMPLMAAAPDGTGRSLAGLTLLAVPVIAGYLIARTIARHLGSRSERVLASAVAAALTGVLLGGLSWVARGGVGTGLWSAMGAKPMLLAAVVAVELAAVAVATSLLGGVRTVPWRADAAADAGAERHDVDESADAGAAAPDVSDGDGSKADWAGSGTSDSDAGNIDAASAGAADSAAADVDADKTGPADLDADSVGAADPDASDPDVADPDAFDPDGTRAHVGEDGSAATSGSGAPTDEDAADPAAADAEGNPKASWSVAEPADGDSQIDAPAAGTDTDITQPAGDTVDVSHVAHGDTLGDTEGVRGRNARGATDAAGTASEDSDGRTDSPFAGESPDDDDVTGIEARSSHALINSDAARTEPADTDAATDADSVVPTSARPDGSIVTDASFDPVADERGGVAADSRDDEVDATTAADAVDRDGVVTGHGEADPGHADADPDRAVPSAAVGPGVVLPEQRGHMAVRFAPDR